MPSRWIKVGYCDSDRIQACCASARDLWVRLLVNADDYGRFDARPAVVAAKCFPLQTGCAQLVANCEQWLSELERADLIRRYEASGKSYLFITRFYERPRTKPRFPEPPQELAEKELPSPEQSVCRCAQPDSRWQPPTSTSTTTSTTTNHDHNPPSGGNDPGAASPTPTPSKLPAVGKQLPTKRKQTAESNETWRAFTAAYVQRYGVEPLRDARANAQMASFVKRVGIDDAPHIAAFFVGHSKGFYVARQHSVALLLSDADALRTQWLNGRKVTSIEARDTERTASTGDQVERVMRMVREEGEKA